MRIVTLKELFVEEFNRLLEEEGRDVRITCPKTEFGRPKFRAKVLNFAKTDKSVERSDL